MNRIISITRCFGALAIMTAMAGSVHAVSTETLKYNVFGKIIIYKPAMVANAFVLLLSGENGWNKTATGIAKNVVSQGAIVVGIDTRIYLKNLRTQSLKCYYPAGDLEELSMFLQKKYKLTRYHKPILIGYSSGATLAYGALAQAPANTFKGVVALAFSPEIKTAKPLCEGAGLKQLPAGSGKSALLEASENLTAPFIALHGSEDKVNSLPATQQFIKGVNTGQFVELPNTGHDFAVSSAWLPQFTEAYKKTLAAPTFAEQKATRNTQQSQKLVPLPDDFPVIVIPSAIKDTLPMVFLISGDGGWTSFDNSLGEALAAKGMPVVGLDAQKYFWNAKTPEESAAAVAKAILHFMQQWNKKKVILAGYSFGAGVVPFIADRLPVSLKNALAGVYSLSPGYTADFEIHISDMLDIGTGNDTYKVPDELIKIRQFHPVCIFGMEESAKTRSLFSETGAKIFTVPGNHHYNNNPSAAADVIIAETLKNAAR